MTVWLPEPYRTDGEYGFTNLKNPTLGAKDHILNHKLLAFKAMSVLGESRATKYLKTDAGWVISDDEDGTEFGTLSEADFDASLAAQLDADGNHTLPDGLTLTTYSVIFNSDGEVRLYSADYEVGEYFVDVKYNSWPIKGKTMMDTILDAKVELEKLQSRVNALENPTSP